MRTTLQLPDDLVRKAARVAKSKTKTETIIIALTNFIRRGQVDQLINAAGDFKIRPVWKKMRHGR